MNNSMIKSLVTMQALQLKLDTISNNIANVQTPGFKKREAVFEETLASVMRQPERFQLPNRVGAAGLSEGWGAIIGQLQIRMEQGQLQPTDRPLDLAIEGDALFEVIRYGDSGAGAGAADLVPAWTRYGAFQLTPLPDGADPDNMYLSTQDGYFVRGTDDELIAIPNGASFQVSSDGTISITELGESEPQEIGRLKLMRAVLPQFLEQIGDHLFVVSNGADNTNGQIIRQLAPEEESMIAVRQGFIELSNVSLQEEMTNLIAMQRAYQLNARALSSADTMMNLANHLRA